LAAVGFLAFHLACEATQPAPNIPLPLPRPATAPADPAPEPGFIGVVVAGESIELAPVVEARLEALLIEPGQQVKAGTPVARLDLRAAGHELASARAALRDASRRLTRRVQLRRSRPAAITTEELDTARRELQQEKARVAQLEEARADALVRAPFDGVMAEVYLAAGALAGPAKPLGRLVGRGQPRVRFAVPEERAGSLSLGHEVDVRLGGEGRSRRGRVTGFSPEVDSASRMIHAAATLDADNGERLSTGVIARVFLSPPRAAVLHEPGVRP
jgi:RND family efflux transporter MFP subunit